MLLGMELSIYRPSVHDIAFYQIYMYMYEPKNVLSAPNLWTWQTDWLTDLIAPLVDDGHVDVVDEDGHSSPARRPVRAAHALVDVALHRTLYKDTQSSKYSVLECVYTDTSTCIGKACETREERIWNMWGTHVKHVRNASETCTCSWGTHVTHVARERIWNM